MSSAGLAIVAEAFPEPDAATDTFIIAGGAGVHAVEADADAVAQVRQCADHAPRVASVCSGAFLLAATGMLAGRRVTTHWERCEQLARRYPDLIVERDPIFLNDGRFWTSAGVTAGIDLTLALVEADLGRSAALAIARHLVVFAKRPGGQAQFSAGLALSGADARFDTLHGWISQHLAQDLSVPRLANQAGMSERSFVRQYHAITGVTPARAVERLRIEAAQLSLGSSPTSIKEVARRCGFRCEETMRRSFLRVLAVSPSDYRVRFHS
jgi:transcriptional regulator GlxA family with amidase domain